ncbi:MAG: biotin-dependent carboxyltransferase [Acidimicrobiia bacterium]|nr:biotin-dependent carboxyltransferase [Acidimicrobiia bacterium]
MASLLVLRPGLLSTVQDLGRWGWQAFGVSASGPMDSRAHRLANALVGNPPEAATLEITLVGPELAFDDERVVAICGADFVVTVGDHLASHAASFRVPAGGHLRFGRRGRGTRAYLAVEGGLAVASVLGSRSTHVPSGMGGHAGRPLTTDDRVPLGPKHPQRSAGRRAPTVEMPDGRARLRVLPIENTSHFPTEALAQLQSEPYTLRPESNRMGYRLVGPVVASETTGTLLSQPSPIGSIQVPPDGQPILLMADRQTTGGYPVLGTVISADLGLAGQLGPGDTVSFTVCTRQEALAALIAQERLLMAPR